MKTLLITLMLLVTSFAAQATEQTYDPLARNLIYVEGRGELIVPITSFKLRFSFNKEKGSFDEASMISDSVIAQITQQLKKNGIANMEVIKGWDVVRQAGIALGAKGKNISNQVMIQVNG